MECITIGYDTPRYKEMLALRQEVLRAPLGLDIYAESLCEEASQWLYGLIDNDRLMACLIAKPIDDTTAKLRQMAVAPEAQGKGFGAVLLRFVEADLQARGIQRINLHARCSASEFYTKAGYGIQSEVFAEVGIPHVSMAKDL